MRDYKLIGVRHSSDNTIKNIKYKILEIRIGLLKIIYFQTLQQQSCIAQYLNGVRIKF